MWPAGLENLERFVDDHARRPVSREHDAVGGALQLEVAPRLGERPRLELQRRRRLLQAMGTANSDVRVALTPILAKNLWRRSIS